MKAEALNQVPEESGNPLDRLTPRKRPDAERFSLENVEHDFIRRYHPQFVASGGEHLVYEIPGRPDIVVKAEKLPLVDIARWNQSHKLPANAYSKYAKEYGETILVEDRKRMATLRKIFGRHVVNQKKFFVKVPVTQKIMEDCLKKLESDTPVPLGVTEAWTYVTIQPRVRELADPDRLDLLAGREEIHAMNRIREEPEFRDLYRRVTQPLLNAEQARRMDFDTDAFLDLIDQPGLDELVDRMETDKGLRAAVRDFVEKTMAFAEQTGDVFDFVGSDNIIFVQRADGSWDYRLVDPFMQEFMHTLAQARRVLEKAETDPNLSDAEWNLLLHAVDFTRYINGLGRLVGSKKFLTFLPAEHSDTDVLPILMHPFMPQKFPLQAFRKAA